MTIKEIQDSIVEEFSMFDDWMDRYSMLIEMGKDCPMIDAQYRNDNYLINGCQSRVWLHAKMEDGKVYYSADSDAHFVDDGSQVVRVDSVYNKGDESASLRRLSYEP